MRPWIICGLSALICEYLRRKNKCGPGQPPKPHRSWFPALASSPLGGGMTASARQRSKGVPRFAKASCRFVILRSQTCNRCGGQRPWSCSLLQRAKSMGERRPQRPGQPVALARVFWSVRQRFTLENRRLPLALPQSFGKLRNSHVSLNSLSARFSPLAIQKNCAVVQKLWRMRLPCGSRRKTEN